MLNRQQTPQHHQQHRLDSNGLFKQVCEGSFPRVNTRQADSMNEKQINNLLTETKNKAATQTTRNLASLEL